MKTVIAGFERPKLVELVLYTKNLKYPNILNLNQHCFKHIPD